MEVLCNEPLAEEVNKLVDETTEYLCIVSPYIEMWEEMYFKLEKLSKKVPKIKVSVFIREVNEGMKNKEIKNENKRKFIENTFNLIDLGVDVFSIENLHAKIFINEKTAIMGSINLTEFAFKKSVEMGIKANRDEEEYDKIKRALDEHIVNRGNVQYKINLLKNKIKDISKYNINISFENSNLLVIEHDYYKMRIYMGNNNVFLNAYSVYFDLSSEKWINLINKNIPTIKKEAYGLIFTRKDEILEIYSAYPFLYSNIEKLIKGDFTKLEYKLKNIISGIEKIICKLNSKRHSSIKANS